MTPLSDSEVKSALEEIEAAQSAQQTFDTISRLSKRLGFDSCVVFEAIVSVDGKTNENGRKGDAIAIVFNDRVPSTPPQKKTRYFRNH